jgi:hypothetical protein
MCADYTTKAKYLVTAGLTKPIGTLAAGGWK